MRTSEVYRAARNELLFGRGWYQGDYEQDVEAGKGPVCLFGAVSYVQYENATEDEEASAAAQLLVSFGKAVGVDNMSNWNDNPERKLEQVIELLDVMEKIAEEQE